MMTGVAGSANHPCASAYKRPVGPAGSGAKSVSHGRVDSSTLMGRQPFAVPDPPQRVRDSTDEFCGIVERHVCNRIRSHFPLLALSDHDRGVDAYDLETVFGGQRCLM
jgi:hypothetical protein